MSPNNKEPRGQAEAKGASRGGTYRLAGFPREFERNILEDLDKRFYAILFGSWALVYAIAIILGNTEYDLDALNAKARENYLQKFYQAEIIEPIETTQEDEGGLTIGEDEAEEQVDERAERDRGRQGEARGPSAREVAEARRAAAVARSAARRQMQQEVAGTGVLGVLSAGGGGGSGDAVADVLGEAGGGLGDLNAVLSGVGGLATASSGGQRTRLGSRGGGRVTGSADVGELLSGVGTAGSANIGRKGSIQMALDAARVSGAGTKSANRSSDELSRIINSHNDAIEYCYKRESKLDPNLKGDVMVEFVIAYNGRVTNVRVTDSSLRNKQVESCIIGRIRGWRFKPISKAEGDVTVRQKYIFG